LFAYLRFVIDCHFPPLALFLKSQQVELISKSGLALLILHINLLINGYCR